MDEIYEWITTNDEIQKVIKELRIEKERKEIEIQIEKAKEECINEIKKNVEHRPQNGRKPM